MKQIEARANKEPSFDFYDKVMEKLRDLDSRHGRLIRFPLVFWRLGCNFGLTKTEIKLILQDLTNEGRIEFCAFNGIKIVKGNGLINERVDKNGRKRIAINQDIQRIRGLREE